MKLAEKHAQLTQDELQQLKWLLGGVVTLLSVATVLYFDIAAWTLMTLTTAAVIAVMARPHWPARVPVWAHRLSFPAIVAVFTTDLWLSGELLPAMVRLDILLLLYRGISYRRKREDLQVIVLGLFLVVVAGVLTVSLTFAVHILVFTAAALAMLLVITLADASSNAVVEPNSPGSTPRWAQNVDWGRLLRRVRQVTDWRVVVMCGGLFLGLVALSILLFIAIPRFQLENGLFLERFISKKARSGFSDTIRFGDVTEIQLDNSVAAIVDVSDREQIPAAPYWRMLVLDEYRDGTFRLSTALRRVFSGERHGVVVRGMPKEPVTNGVTWTVYLESGVSRFLPLLGAFEQLQFTERQSFRNAPSLSLVELREEPVTMIAYRVEGMESRAAVADVEFGARLRAQRDNPLAAAGLMLGLTLNETDLGTLARITNEFDGNASLSAEEFGRRATAWLAQQHAYSLQPRTPPGPGDPLVRWLNSREGGHCELFAGSLVALARARGLPARIVTGFRGGSWNGFSNNFTLRNSDAHAWCELFDDASQSWLRVDPTPGRSSREIDEAVEAGRTTYQQDRSWNARLESLRVFWYRQIVSFDQQSQLETLHAMKQATENSSRRVRQWTDRVGKDLRAWLAAPWTWGRAMTIVATLLAVSVVAWLIRGWEPAVWKWPWRRGTARGDAVRREAGRWLAKLEDRVRTMPDTDKMVWRELQRLRYGARETWPDAAGVFRRARRIPGRPVSKTSVRHRAL